MGIHPPGHFERVDQRGERFGLGPDDPPGKAPRDEAARDLHDLAIPLGDDQPDPRALALEHGVGRDRRAVEEDLDVGRGDIRLGAHRRHAVEDPDRTVGGRRRRLVPPETPRLLLQQQQVGEGSADVDAQTIAHACSPFSTIGGRDDGKRPALETMPGSGRPMIGVSHFAASISASRSRPVAMPERSSR